MGFVREQVAKLDKRGVVKAVRTPPRCINPLSVAAKELGDKKRLRLCLDLSRHVNKALRTEPCKLATLASSVAMIFPNDWMAVYSYDLASAYHHIRIADNDQQYLGFAVTALSGEEEFFLSLRDFPSVWPRRAKCLTESSDQ